MPLDYTVLDELSAALGRPSVAKLVRIYLDQTENQISRLAAIEGAAAAEEHRRLVHSLRGGSIQLGTRRLVLLCAALEQDLRATGRRLSAAEIDHLRDTTRETRAALLDWLDRPGAKA